MEEKENGQAIEFESREIVFLENDFLKLGKVDKVFTFFEIKESDSSRSLNPSGGIEFESENDVFSIFA